MLTFFISSVNKHVIPQINVTQNYRFVGELTWHNVLFLNDLNIQTNIIVGTVFNYNVEFWV